MTFSRFEQDLRAALRQRDLELERLKKKRDELLVREKAARTEAATAQRRLSELSSMSRTFASSMRDVSVERQRARRRLAVQHAVGGVLAKADGLEDAAAGILKAIGEGLGWDLGALWTVDEGAGVLRCIEVWRAPESPSSGEMNGHQDNFESASRRKSLPRGSGLPGRVWARGEALWIEDVLEGEGFLRPEAAAGEGLRKAFAFPIKDGGRTRGVVEFFGREAAPPDEDLLRAAVLAGNQIGQFTERRLAERERDRLLTRERAARAEADAARREKTSILESINDAFVAFDHDWRYTYANGAAHELTRASGRDPENILGKVLWKEFPEFAGTGFQTGLLRATREGETVEFEEFYPPLDAWFHVRAYPSEDGVSVYVENVTERKETEEALRQNEARWRALIVKGADVITISDRDGTIRFASPSIEKVSGYTVEEFVGTNPFEAGHFHPDDVERCEEAFRELADNPGHSVTIQHRYRHKSGGWRWLEGTFTSLFHDPAIGGLVANFRDITGRREAEEERERFLAQEWTVRAQTEERRRISRELHDRVAHSMGVVHQSLELHEAFKERKPSQAEAKMKLARETTREALDLTRSISRELLNTEAKDGLSAALSNLLKTAVPPGLKSSISVEGDESLIPPRIREQLFLILREAVRNTVSHSGAGRLDIEVKASPERVVGCVEDDGRGFEETSEGDNGASGRGLQSMRERIELVGGDFGLFSTPGASTKIVASVPLDTNRAGEQIMAKGADE